MQSPNVREVDSALRQAAKDPPPLPEGFADQVMIEVGKGRADVWALPAYRVKSLAVAMLTACVASFVVSKVAWHQKDEVPSLALFRAEQVTLYVPAE